MLSPEASGRLISGKAEQVNILEEGIDNCAKDILSKVQTGELGTEGSFNLSSLHPQTPDNKGIDWLFFANTVNFSFWAGEDEAEYVVTYCGQTYTGNMALWAAINRALDQGINLIQPTYFKDLSLETLGKLLQGDQGVPIPLLQERLDCLREVGPILVNKWQGSFHRIVEAAGNSAVGLLNLIVDNFPCFRDTGTFQGQTVTFYKRAQVLVADIWRLAQGQGRGEMKDIDHLSMLADYRVPQSLQSYGVFKYGDKLMAHLKAGNMLESGDIWELEIRGCSIEAVRRITQRVNSTLRERGDTNTVNAILVDKYLWGYRRKHSKDIAKFPFHRVRSIYY